MPCSRSHHRSGKHAFDDYSVLSLGRTNVVVLSVEELFALGRVAAGFGARWRHPFSPWRRVFQTLLLKGLLVFSQERVSDQAVCFQVSFRCLHVVRLNVRNSGTLGCQ